MVKKKCAAVVAGLGLAVAGVAVPASSAHAASLPTVSSPACGTIRINPRAYTGSAAIKVFFDAGFYEGPVKAGGAVVTDSGLPGVSTRMPLSTRQRTRLWGEDRSR